MESTLLRLPDDLSALKKIIHSQASSLADIKVHYTRKEEAYQERVTFLEEGNTILAEQARFFKGRLYGRKSEKLTEEELQQTLLFDEAEDILIDLPPEEERAESITVPAHTRRKRGRRVLPASLPRVEVIYYLSEEKKQCACGHLMCRIGEDVSGKLDIIPARIRVIKHIRYKYACKGCEGVESEGGAVRIAPLPPQRIP